MTTQTNNLSALLAELVKFSSNGDYTRALKTANKVLQLQPNEENALSHKIICLLHLSRFQDALQTLKQAPKPISENLIFEKSYCQYRQAALQDALKTINSAPEESSKLKELKAQILYRLERYEECYDIYQEIIKSVDDEYQDERLTNLSAVVANLTIEGSSKEVAPVDESTYELVYNGACRLIGLGQYAEAEKKLRLAEKMCREAQLEDGASEEDIEEEVGIIRIQLGFVIQTLGREKEALDIYNSVLKRKLDDIGLVAVASNNVVVINRDQHVFDSKKKMKSATLENLDQKLTSRQRKEIALNHCLFALHTNQVDLCTQLSSKLAAKFPEMEQYLALIKGLLLAKSGKAKQASKVLLDYASAHPESQPDIGLAAVQLLLQEGDTKTASSILENLGEYSYKPGIVSALVTLYLAQDDRKTASKILEKAVDWYRKNKVSSDKDNLESLWKQAADYHIRQGEPDVAAKSLEELIKVYPDDKKLQAKLLIAYAQFDQNKAESLSKKLALDSKSTDVDALEALSWIMGTKVIKKASKVDQTPGSANTELIQKVKKQRRKKPGKLPKNYDPSVPPNPERWLPRHERSGYRKNKRERERDRRNKDSHIGKGTQGDAANIADQFDITKMSSQAKQSIIPNSPPPVDVEGPRRKGHQMKKKKRK